MTEAGRPGPGPVFENRLSEVARPLTSLPASVTHFIHPEVVIHGALDAAESLLASMHSRAFTTKL